MCEQNGDPLKSAEEDKFLKDFEDPSVPSAKSKHHRSADADDATSSDEDSATTFLNKGSDPLKSAESDKFLRGFLG